MSEETTTNAAPMRLRAETPRVTRLSRKMLAKCSSHRFAWDRWGADLRVRPAIEAATAKNFIRPKTALRRTVSLRPACRAITVARSGRHYRAILAVPSLMPRTEASPSRRLLWQRPLATLLKSGVWLKRRLRVAARLFSSQGREPQRHQFRNAWPCRS